MENKGIEKVLDLDKIIKDKSPSMYKFMPKFIMSYLKRLLHQDDLNEMIHSNPDAFGVDFGEVCVNRFQVSHNVVGLDEIDKNGRYLFVANHPLGGLDGIIFMNIVGRVFNNIKFPVNDILLYIGKFNEIFVPINKYGSQAKESAIKIEEAYASDSQMLLFPAGMCSRKIKGQISDLEWKPSFIKKAIKHKRDIVPVYIDARNSNFFYNLSRFRTKMGIKANIELLFLVDEMFKQQGKNVDLVFGKPIEYTNLTNGESANVWKEKIRKSVYALAK